MTVLQNNVQIFAGVFECVDLADLAEAVSEGVRAFQHANPKLTKQARLDPLSIELKEV